MNEDNILLIDPPFPTSNKSRNNQEMLPIGLLKIGAMLKDKGKKVELYRMNNPTPITINPQTILITSTFTYYSKYVTQAVQYARKHYPQAKIIVGGIFASLQPILCKQVTGCDEVYQGIIEEAEQYPTDYTLLPDGEEIKYQILHTSRGCVRNCDFCGSYLIEPKFSCKRTIKDLIFKKHLIFYDNNFLANPFIEDILNELIELKKDRRISSCECQSGIDYRILLKKPHLAKMMYDAGFRKIYIAWDTGVEEYEKIKKTVDILEENGFNRTQKINVFILYNHEQPFKTCEWKRVKCFEMRVQIMDCRYRPLTLLEDNYNPYKPNDTNYYIHPNWTNEEIRTYRKNIRRQNICVRWRIPCYYRGLEDSSVSKEMFEKLNENERKQLKGYWNPKIITKLETKQTRIEDMIQNGK